MRAIEPAYENWLAREDAPKNLAWFAGYASIRAAERWRQSNLPREAEAAYDRALAHYASVIEADPSTEVSSKVYMSFALAGRARIKMETQDLDGALADLLAALETSPESAALLDGLELSAYVTSITLRARLLEAGKDADAAELAAAVATLPENARRRPAYDTPGAPSADASRFGGGPGGDR